MILRQASVIDGQLSFVFTKEAIYDPLVSGGNLIGVVCCPRVRKIGIFWEMDSSRLFRIERWAFKRNGYMILQQATVIRHSRARLIGRRPWILAATWSGQPSRRTRSPSKLPRQSSRLITTRSRQPSRRTAALSSLPRQSSRLIATWCLAAVAQNGAVLEFASAEGPACVQPHAVRRWELQEYRKIGSF